MLPELLQALKQGGRIVIGTHVNPDGDALGSALAFSFALDQLGLTHEVYCHHPAPRILEYLPGLERLRQTPEDLTPPDLAIILDLEALDRLGPLRTFFESARRTIVIDHHVPHEEPGDLRIVTTTSPATAAILADLFLESEITINADMATCLLTGIVTDTGSFRFPNTTAHCLHAAAALLERGARLNELVEHVYMSRTIPAMRLHGWAMSRLKLDCENQLAWTVIPLSAFEECHASDEDTEGLVNEMLAIGSVQVAAILRESKLGRIRGSIRSRGKIDVAEAARQFGGGGHKNAAGVSFEGDIWDAERALTEALRQCLASP